MLFELPKNAFLKIKIDRQAGDWRLIYPFDTIFDVIGYDEVNKTY